MGKKGKKGKKSGKGPGLESSASDLDEVSKEFYLIQIRDLENRVARYARKSDELEIKQNELENKKNSEIVAKDEVIGLCKKDIVKKDEEIDVLTEKVDELEKTLEVEREESSAKIKEMEIKATENLNALRAEVTLLNGKLSALEEFRVKKDEYLERIQELEEQIKIKDEDHEDTLYEMDKKAVADKDRLKKEMVNRVNAVAQEFRKVSNQQMAATSKRAIRENAVIQAQLTKMSDKTLEVLSENDSMKEEFRRQKLHHEMLEETEKALAKKNNTNKRMVQMLTEKCTFQENVITELQREAEYYAEVRTEFDMASSQIKSQREEIQHLQADVRMLEEELRTTRNDLSTERRHKRRLEKLIKDCTIAIKMVLRKTEPEEEPIMEGEMEDINEIERRDNMLENILLVLNSGAAIGVGPQMREFGKGDKVVRKRSASRIPGSEGGIKRGQLPLSPVGPLGGTLPHYQMGDLGLIPRPKVNIPTSFDRMRVLSATTRLGGLRKVLTRSVSVQTVSATKALFYADQLLTTVPADMQDTILHEGHTGRIRSPVKPVRQITGPKKFATTVY
ncbi:cilia- and flagella-associated protein 157-like [Mytilus trossulus]|uniref:cilia- and flagella-associated protein 157-like n=1 Tax=Mytilus trossulus TaxID=6551 RepID=UPI0030042BAD